MALQRRLGPARRRVSTFATQMLLGSALVIAGCGTGGGRSDDETLDAISLEDLCTATCQKMGALAFPKELCKDADAESHDAYFCQSIYWSPCQDSCVAAVREAPTDECRASWEPLMTCVAESDGYIALLFSQPSFGECRSLVDSVGKACWGDTLAP
jgi:hypothetical protein